MTVRLAALACRLVLGVVASLALIAVGPGVAGLPSTVVMSDSMAPGIRAGDIVVVRPVAAAHVRPGQVVLADDPDFPGRLRLHRAVGRRGADLVLRGDANAQDDPSAVRPGAVHGIGFLRVPWVGLPLLWLRTGRWPLALLALTGIVLLAAAVARLERQDPPPGGAARPWLRSAAVRLVRSRPGRATMLAVVIGSVVPAAVAVASSWSVFTSPTPVPSNTASTSTWVCPAVPSPAPGIFYAFMSASGTAEPNLGTVAGYGATLSSASLRTTGTCGSNASPAVRFTGTGSESVVGTSAVSAGSTGTQSLWFYPTQATGVLVGIGPAGGNDATKSDRQLYFTTGGQLAYAQRDGSSVRTCATSAAIALNSWHFAAVTFNASSTPKAFTFSVDGSAVSCASSSITTPSTFTGYTRIGTDLTIATDAATTPYSGLIDSVGAWGSVLTATQLNAIYAAGN